MKKKTKINCKPLLEFFRSQWKNLIHVLGITVLAVLFARIIVYDLMSLSVFAPMEKATDFQMLDIYQSVAESKAIHHLSSDVTIVSIDGYSRADVLDAINLISEYSPAAIGLDIFFPIPEVDNTYLLSTLSTAPNMVCSGMFERDQDASTFHHLKQSFFEDSINVTYGYVNLNASSQRDVIRQFVPYVLTSNGDTLFSMPANLARLYSPKRFNTCIARNSREETIAFENIEFPIIPVQDILSGEADETLLTNRVVLIGDVQNINDSYLSPLHEPIPGIKLHAYALQTILSGNYINSSATWLNWFIAILLCMFFVVCNIFAKYRLGNLDNLFIRIAQFVIMYILLVIGCVYFARHHAYIDFSPSILMIGFGAVAFDLWFGCYTLYELIKSKISKK